MWNDDELVKYVCDKKIKLISSLNVSLFWVFLSLVLLKHQHIYWKI